MEENLIPFSDLHEGSTKDNSLLKFFVTNRLLPTVSLHQTRHKYLENARTSVIHKAKCNLSKREFVYFNKN